MPPRLHCLSLLVLLAAALLTGGPVPAASPRAEVADLQEQLEKGLRARRPEEFQFIRNVVILVRNDVLPVTMVKSTFQWARRKAQNKRYPFPYFERALRERAAKIGVVIP